MAGCGMNEDSYALLILALFVPDLSTLCQKHRETHLYLSTMLEFAE